jgi:23S rRNA (cytidine1920-2'-O)/16S rRNA (cytidine1409-2'-O)-methyltransferase
MIKKERLDIRLLELELAESRQKAQAEIMAGNVLVDEAVITKPGTQVKPDSQIRLRDKFPYVGRGAIKLIKALKEFQIEVNGKICIDIGSSTGGFTEVLLERGASMVYAVDSGTNQLAWKLRTDPRVKVMENTNARYIDQIPFDSPPELATIDVSFISLTKILGPLSRILKEGFQIITLIKPQFELSPEDIGERGLVHEKFHRQAIDHVLEYAVSIGLKNSRVIESPISGAKSGNKEFLTVFINS